MSDDNQLRQESIKPISKTTTVIKRNIKYFQISKLLNVSSYLSVLKQKPVFLSLV